MHGRVREHSQTPHVLPYLSCTISRAQTLQGSYGHMLHTSLFLSLIHTHTHTYAYIIYVAGMHVQGGQESWDALGCRSLSTTEPLIIGLFCGK